MPLQDGDVEVIDIQPAQRKSTGNKMQEGKAIRFRVRGMTDETIFIAESEYTKIYAEQMILRAAAEIVDLYDRFPIRE